MDEVEKYRKAQDKFYKQRFQDFGYSAQADGWTSEKISNLVYEHSSKILKTKTQETPFSILDIGSGCGFYYKYLQEQGYNIQYTGLEINEHAFKEAKKSNLDAKYIHDDFMKHDFKAAKFDFVISIGALGINDQLSPEETKKYATRFLDKMYQLASNGICFTTIETFLGENTFIKFYEWCYQNLSDMISVDGAYFPSYATFNIFKKSYLLSPS